MSVTTVPAQTTKKQLHQLNAEQNRHLQLAIAEPFVKDYSVVDFEVDIAEEPYEVEIEFPGLTGKYKAKKTKVDKVVNKHWKGDFLRNNKKYDGDVIELMDEGGGKYGYAHLRNNYYTILPLGDGLSVIIWHDLASYTPDSCGVTGKLIDTAKEFLQLRNGPNSGNCLVKILVIHTQNAQNQLGSLGAVVARANTSIAQTNTAFNDSGINGIIIGSGSTLINWSENPNGTSETLNAMKYQQFIWDLRAAAKADIVVLLAKYTNPVVGRAYSLNPNDPFATVNIGDAINGRHTFAHEVGHIYNAQHENDDTAPPGRAFIFNAGGSQQYTVVTDNQPLRLLRYSNPSSLFNGVPTGDATHDNSFNINTNFCVINSWVNSNDVTVSPQSNNSYPGVLFTIYGHTQVDWLPAGTLRWYADTYPNPTTLKLTQTLSGTTTSGAYTFTFPSIPLNSYYYVRCQFTPNSGGGAISKTVSIKNTTGGAIFPINEEMKIISGTKLNVFPNPTHSSYSCNFELFVDKSDNPSGTLILLDLKGNEIQRWSYQGQFGTLSLEGITPGLYIIRDVTSGSNAKIQVVK